MLHCEVGTVFRFEEKQESNHYFRKAIKYFRKAIKIFGQFRSLPFDDVAAASYASVRAELSAKGSLIGPYDLQIAAIALANDLTLVTHNTSEFSRVSGLRIEDWEA